MSVLREWYREARAEGRSESQAVRVVARRLGEDEKTARRVLVRAGARLGGAQQSRSSNNPTPLNVAAVQAAYCAHRKAGLDPERAVKSTARQFDARPHDIRRMTGVTEFEMRETGA